MPLFEVDGADADTRQSPLPVISARERGNFTNHRRFATNRRANVAAFGYHPGTYEIH